jgi:fatty acyl-CoA reductase
MGILSISYSSNLLTKLIKVPENNNWYIPTRRKTTTNVVVFCHQGGGSSGNVIKSSNLSNVLTERTSLVSSDHATTTLMDAGSLVLSQNGKTQSDIVVKDIVPFGGPTSTTLINGLEDDGIGIVKFLRGKKFFVTGATGFLAKGIINLIYLKKTIMMII